MNSNRRRGNKKNRFTRSHMIKTPGGLLGKRLSKAHAHTSHNRDELMHSSLCGCGSCAKIFPVSEITEWVDGGETALCPHCGVDILIGDASGIDLTPEFLGEMSRRYF